MVKNPETVMMDISEAKANLVKIQKLCDETILKRVQLDSECKLLESRKLDIQNQVKAFEENLASKRKVSQKIDEDIASNSITLGNLQVEAKKLSEQIILEKEAIDIETARLQKLRSDVEQMKAQAIQLHNESLMESEIVSAKKTEIQKILNHL